MQVKVIEFNSDNVTLLPPAPGKCPQCAVDHEPHFPHNQQSLHWQYWFYLRNQRFPTWTDAMRHCTPEMRYIFSGGLMERGVIPFEIHRNWGVPKW